MPASWRAGSTKYFGAGTTYRSFTGDELPFPSALLATLARWHHVAFLRSRETREQLRRLRWSCSNPSAVAALEALVEGNYAFHLFHEIERAKCALSASEATAIRFAHDAIDIDEPLTRADFESLIAADQQRIQRCLHARAGGRRDTSHPTSTRCSSPAARRRSRSSVACSPRSSALPS